MFEWKPVFAPETETGGVEPDTSDTPPPELETEPAETDTEQSDGPGSGRTALRKSLEKGFDDARKATEASQKREARKSKVAGDRVGSRLATMPDSGAGEATQTEEVEEPVTLESNPPDGWTQEAKAAWANTPDEVRAAVLKREQDMANGVKALKSKYAEIDAAFPAARLQALQLYGHTPGQAVNQLFNWFDSLRDNPDVAFPALARSFGYDLRRFLPQQHQQPAQQATQAGAQPAAGAQPGQATPQGFNQRLFEQRARAYLDQQYQQQVNPLNQRIEQLQSIIAQQNQSKTEENLSIWSKDKPYYEDVRERMAYLIGSGAVPTKDGKVDLDGAYEQAIWSLPEVRNRIMQDQAAARRADQEAKKKAEAKAQAEQAEKARKAATSVPLSAPGTSPAARPGQRTSRKSVGDTLREAIAQHRTS